MLCVEHEMVLLDAAALNHVSISWFDLMHDREKRPKMMALLNVSMLILKDRDRDCINHFNIQKYYRFCSLPIQELLNREGYKCILLLHRECNITV